MAGESNIVTQMRIDDGHWQLADDVAVENLEPLEFLDRYIDAVALGDTAIFGNVHAMYGVNGMSVSPWDSEAQRALYERIRTLRGEVLDVSIGLPNPNPQPISREAAEAKVQAELEARQKTDAYYASSSLSRFGKTILMLCGRSSGRPTLHEEITGYSLPSYIYFHDRSRKEEGRSSIVKVIVNKSVDDNFTPREAASV